MSKDELEARCDDFLTRMEGIAASNLTPEGMTSAVALLTTLKGFALVRDLREALATPPNGGQHETE